jgi:MSHA biogenesis protein MshE
MKPERRKKIRLGELLIEQKVINEEQLAKALAEQKRTGRKLGRVLTDLGIVEEQHLNDALARHLQIPFVDLRQLSLDQAVVRLLPEALARRFRALVLQQDKNGLTVGMADPTDLFVYDELVARLKQPLRIALVRESELLRTMDIVYRRTEPTTSTSCRWRWTRARPTRPSSASSRTSSRTP